MVQALRGHDAQPRLSHMFTVKHGIVLRGQVVRPAVMRPLALYSGRNLPLGHEAPPTVPWVEPGGGYFAQKREITKEHTKNTNYSHVLNLSRVGFLCLAQRCGLTAAKAQSLSLHDGSNSR